MTSDKRLGLLCKASLLLFTLGSAGCTQPEDDEQSNNDGTTGSMQVKLSGSVALLAQDETVTEAAKAYQKLSSTGKPLFTYEVVDQGATEDASGSRKAGIVAGVDTTSGGSNLLAIAEDGTASLAIESDLPIKVMYSVTDPDGEYVYLALDSGWWGGNYAQFVGINNCALYKVKIADDTFSCVKEGVQVQSMEQNIGTFNYMQTVSGNQKPIQFDSEGNVYFAATAFTVECSDWDGDGTPDADSCWLSFPGWNAQVYRVSTDGVVTELTHDDTAVDFFLALPTGQVAYQSHNTTTWETSLRMWQTDGSTVDLTSNVDWGVNFFTTDTNNAVIFGSWSNPGIQFARPRADGFLQSATLDTSLFGTQNQNSGQSTTPLRIIVGDDGKLYGVFDGWKSECFDTDQDGYCSWDETVYNSVLAVYQVLPYDPIPKAELVMEEGTYWWDVWMGSTPFQIAKGHLYYKEQITVPGKGLADVIRMVNLDERTTRTLLDEDLLNKRYLLQSWKLSGDTLYFSGEDTATTTVITGTIDTAAARNPNNTETDYLVVNQSASAIGALAQIRDIELLVPQQPAENTGSSPVVMQWHVSPDNLYSASIEFSKYMNKPSVEENLSFTSTETLQYNDYVSGAETLVATNEVPVMKVWIQQILHLIPDRSDIANTANQWGLLDGVTTPLKNGTEYTLTLGDGVIDAWSVPLSTSNGVFPKTKSFTTVPTEGWYQAQTDDGGTFSTFGVAKFAGRADPTTSGKETYNLGVTLSSPNVRIEFAARNTGWEGISVALWNKDEADYYSAAVANFRLGSYSSSEYQYNADGWHQYLSADSPTVFNGNWAKYRLEISGASIKVEYSNDGSTWNELSGLAASDFNGGSSTGGYSVLLRVSTGVMIDNLKVTDLSAAESEVLNLNFDTDIKVSLGDTLDDGVGFDDEMHLTYDPDYWWW